MVGLVLLPLQLCTCRVLKVTEGVRIELILLVLLSELTQKSLVSFPGSFAELLFVVLFKQVLQQLLFRVVSLLFKLLLVPRLSLLPFDASVG